MTQTTNSQPKPRKVRGTGIYSGNEFSFKPCEEGPSSQTNIKTCVGGGKRWTTTGSDPSKMITLKSKESSPDQYADFAKQFEALTRDLKPKKPVALPETQRVVDEDGLQCWLNEAKGELTFTGTISLTKNCRNWQAEVLRQVQLIVRRLPASEKFNKVINNIKTEKTSHV